MKNNKHVKKLFLGGNFLRISLILFLCLFLNNVSAQQNLISGKVVDNAGLPIPGANILIKGSKKGVQTDFDGKFSIDAPSKSTLIISYVGMDNANVEVGNKKNINVVLQSSSQSLEEVVVVGYGTKKKSDVISSVASVKTKDMLKVPTSDIGEMLRGKAAGVQVTTNSGGPGSSSTIRIRGDRTLSGNDDPIIIADGVVIGSINDVNANDIASLEILKDAAAQSIYGARASNGVILITTKKGKVGKPKISYNGFSGIQTMNRNFDIYSGEEFAQLKREAARTSNNGVYQPDNVVFSSLELPSVQTGDYIDWEKYMIKTGFTNNHSITVSSATDNTSIYTSLNYIDVKGMIPNSDFEKVSLRVNVDQKINNWLKIGLNTSIQFDESHDPNKDDNGILINSITTSPLGQIYNPDGSYRLNPGGIQETPNPLIDIYETTKFTQNRNDNINLYLDFNLAKGLTYKLNTNRRSWNYKRQSYNNGKSVSGQANAGQGSGQIQFQDNVEYTMSNIFNYNFAVADKNHFGVVAVQEMVSSSYNNFQNNADRIPNDILGIYGLEAAFLNTPNISGSEETLLSGVAKVEYDYDNKYYFTLSGRADGCSRFGIENKWGFFPAANAAWNVHKERFMQEYVPVVNNLKLRASYGQVGNRPENPYLSQATADQRDYIINGVKVSGYIPGSRLSSPDLRWETSTQLNLAVDFGLFKNRLSGTVEVYDTKTTDMIVNAAINQTTGFSNQYQNIGEVNNQGIEVTLNSEIIRNKDFKLNLGASFTKNKNKIVSLYGDKDGDGVEDSDIGNRWFIGQPISVYWQWKGIGIYQVGETIPADAGTGLIPGDIKLYDANPANGAKPEDADRILTPRYPEWYGTVSLNMEYKNFDFSADVYTVQGITRDNPFLYGYNEGASLRGIKNGLKQNYWTPENPSGTWPRPRVGNDPPNLNTIGLQDASYIRLQNISLGYTLPADLIKKLGLGNFRMYVTGNNVITITDFQSYSPEKNASDYPEPVSYVFGLQVGF
ncbi:SusC/RagA family TonB-linked outer membrane protein [Flavobacterium nackdongense]|uniref:TonB-dependent receptor n=1 Tax=Flavobacterium nackdongense TaxID=2547394 RepID=A0A4P6YHQ2_9FLAO|nr:TonB-dependent receptor [Flavobacterium nackdongense]QBN20395.1 TonB-dependent receptor [Flavobacterium nackdongense]